jgi:photosystem II stability/assembly factor-like uncharacterized protein
MVYIPWIIRFTLLPVFAMVASAQWTPQESHSTASLRGVHSLGNGCAWASGSGGTVLRTTNDGKLWQKCSTPEGAEKLDFRAVQAFDAETAVIMSAGTGDLSRIYKTNDGCRTWKLVLSNPDKEGFWDEMVFAGPGLGAVIGDQVDGSFPVYISEDGGSTWRRPEPKGARAEQKNQSLFAASNSSLLISGRKLIFVTGGGTTSAVETDLQFSGMPVYRKLPLASGEAAGGFSIAEHEGSFVAVGGDYKQPGKPGGTAAYRVAGGEWKAASVPPHGYRSAVAWDDAGKRWIAVGPNGADVSTDGGKTWAPADLGQNWNAISLPFLVGSKGAIGRME